MKKVLFPLLAVVLALGLAIPMAGAAPAAAHTAEEPYTTPLMAGQNIEVGNVSVWNDGTNLYVQYVLDDPWVMTGSHLYVGKSDPVDFPSTPGQFPYSPGMEKSPSTGASYDEANMTYTIPLDEIYEYEFVGKGQGKGLNPTGTPGVEPCNDTYIAAHADVVQKIEACMDVVSNASVEWAADGTSWNHTVACYVHPNWINIIGATWIWRTEYTDVVWEYDNVPDGGWYFKKEFTIPGEPLSGEIAINADNTYNLSVNGVYVGKEGSMDKDGPDNHEWSTIDTFDLTNLNSGLNTIEVRALNFFRTGSSTGNPAGLAFIAEVCYEDIIAEETAWGNGTTFGTNWAMYFSYHTQGQPAILVVTQQLSGDNDAHENATVEGYLSDLGYTEVTSIWEPTGGLTNGDLDGYDVVIYLAWSYPAGYTSVSTAQTLMDYFDGGGRLIIIGDDISRVGPQSSPGHPYQPQHPTLGDGWENMTRLHYVNNGGSYELGITDGYLITLGSGHPVLDGIENGTFTYYIDADTTSFLDVAGATSLATAARNSITPYSDLTGGPAIVAYDGDGKIVVIGLAFYNGYYVPSPPNTVPAIPVGIAKTLLDNSINWLW